MFIEEVLSRKTGLGAKYRFESKTLEFKENGNGTRGVFSKVAIPADTEIISLPIKDGSLTQLRAYEESGRILERLGSDRFNLTQSFLLASAMYVRYENNASKQTDILITEPDMEAAYYGSPMSATGSEALESLTNGNNRIALENASKIDSLIKRLNVDERIFRSLLAYCQSRMWADYGLIPVFDWLNSSYGNSANCHFNIEAEHFSFISLKQIAAGEELTWQYNNTTRMNTWFGYGYIDVERPLAAMLDLRMNEGKKIAFENFLMKSLDYERPVINPRNKIDHRLFRFLLSYPGELPTRALLRNEIAEALAAFKNARPWFRAFVLSDMREPDADVTIINLEDDKNIFGIDVEQETISTMQAALRTGLIEYKKRIERFKSSDIGSAIDMNPLIVMLETAHKSWEAILDSLSALLSSAKKNDFVTVINDRFNLSASSKEELIKELRSLDQRNPSVTVSLTLKYVEDFL